MPRPKRQSKPLTREDLHDALRVSNREILTQMSGGFASVRAEMRGGFERMDVRLDATLQIFPTRKEIHTALLRLSRILKTHGIHVEPEALLKS